MKKRKKKRGRKERERRRGRKEVQKAAREEVCSGKVPAQVETFLSSTKKRKAESMVRE